MRNLICAVAASIPLVARAEVPTLGGSAFLVTPPGSWSLSWHDEFEGTTLDESKWSFGLPWPGTDGAHRHHNELYASYMMEDDAKVADGCLLLTTQKRDVTAKNGKVFHYTQAMVTTSGKFQQTYGYFEVRVKLPSLAGPGLWPAFWTLADGWPPEMDICEVWTSTNKSHQGLASRRDGKVSWDDMNEYRPLPTDWTTYGMEWGPGYQVYNTNGRVTKRIYGAHVTDVPHYLLLNSGVAADVPPTLGTVFPNTFAVDYVRVYTRDAMPTVLNGDFEADTLWAWSRYGNAVLVNHAGTQAFRIDGPNSGAEQTAFGLKPNTKYRLSATVRAGAAGADLRLGVKNHGSEESFIRTDATSPTKVHLIFATGQSSTATVYCYAPNSQTWGFFDDVTIEELKADP